MLAGTRATVSPGAPRSQHTRSLLSSSELLYIFVFAFRNHRRRSQSKQVSSKMTSESSTAVVIRAPPPPIQSTEAMAAQQSTNGGDPASPAPSTASSSSVSSASESPSSASCTGSPPSRSLTEHDSAISAQDTSPIIVNGTTSGSVIVRAEKSVSPITDLTLPDVIGGIDGSIGGRRILVDAATLAKMLQACAGNCYQDKLKCLDDLNEQIFRLKDAIARSTAAPAANATNLLPDDGQDTTRDVGCCPRWRSNGETKTNRTPTPSPTSKQHGRRSHSHHRQSPYPITTPTEIANIRSREQQQMLNLVKSELVNGRGDKMGFPDAIDDESLLKCAQVSRYLLSLEVRCG